MEKYKEKLEELCKPLYFWSKHEAYLWENGERENDEEQYFLTKPS